MADDTMFVPSEASSGSATATHEANVTGALSYLNADWVNKQVILVAQQCTDILDSIIGGLLASGYAPFESPVTDEMLQKMTPEQFRTYYDTVPLEEGKADLFARMKALKLPTRELLPPAHPTPSPVPSPHLSFTNLDRVSFKGEAVV